jgi:integrase
METRAVTLIVRYKDADGWKRAAAVYGGNGRAKAGVVALDGKQVQVSPWTFQIRYYEDRKLIYKRAGQNAADAESHRRKVEEQQSIKAAAIKADIRVVDLEEEMENGRVNLRKRANAYIDRQTARAKMASLQTFTAAFDEFLSIVRVEYADQLTEEVVLKWQAALRKRGNSPRTVHNKHLSIFAFLRWTGIDTKKIVKRAPEFTEKIVEVYRPEELKKFFASLTEPYHRMVFQVLLKTGLRMQEAMFLTWDQFDFERGTLRVLERDEAGFVIKDKAERILPIPAELIEDLREWKKDHKAKLVLGTRNDTPNWKWLPLLKRLAKNAELNCGVCKGCKEREECERWFLHKFRATYTTALLRAGIDARTVMQYTGHSDLATVMRYLSPAELPDTQTKVNAIQWPA